MGSIGAIVIGDSVVKALLKQLSIFAGVVLILYIFSIFALPNIKFSGEVVAFLSNGNFKRIMNLIYYFFPVDFALGCLSTIFTVKFFCILWKLANRTINLIDLAKTK